MVMSLVGRALAIAGIVAGLLAIGLSVAFDQRYLDDGTLAASLLVLLCLSSWLPAEVGRDLFGSAAGAAAFGLFLFVPSTAAFENLGELDAGAWLGICTLAIPIGGHLMRAARDESDPRVLALDGLGAPAVSLALVLLVGGIWFDASRDGTTYWNVASSGHAVGVVTLVLAAANVLALVAPSLATGLRSGELAVVIAAATFGYAESGVVTTAFEDFGTLGAGAWIEAAAGALLLTGVLKLRRDAAATAVSGAAAVSHASAP